MDIVALVDSPEHVCCRYRLLAYRTYFEDAGHGFHVRSWPRSCWSRLRIERQVADADAVILQRKLLPGWQLHLVRRASRLLFFDFDDAVFMRDSFSAKGLASARRLQRFAASVESADFVVAGNTFLADQAARWVSRKRVSVIPTCVEPARYPQASHERAGTGVELAWIGSSSTLQGLERIGPLLENLGRHLPGLHLKLICDRFLHLEHLRVIEVPWNENEEAQALATADIGLSWLPDDSWSRGKCGLKVLQYMAAGLPVVANPIGVQAEMIKHGETGFLCATPQQWSDAVGRLMHDPALRRRMGQAGRQRVEREYSVAVGATRWLEILDTPRTGQEAA